MTQTYPELSGPYLNLGIAYLRTDRTTEAEQAVRKALDLNPSNAQAYDLLGLIHREAGSFTAARQDYEQALKLDPLFADVHLNLAILLDLYLGQPQPALEHYERYQQLAGADDKQVALWIADLKKRLPASTPAEGSGS
jgi:Flp pilus assembly protein TadD